jgi:hypothetical protein
VTLRIDSLSQRRRRSRLGVSGQRGPCTADTVAYNMTWWERVRNRVNNVEIERQSVDFGVGASSVSTWISTSPHHARSPDRLHRAVTV